MGTMWNVEWRQKCKKYKVLEDERRQTGIDSSP